MTQGWWKIFRKPDVDADGQWYITEEDTKSGETTNHLYNSEQEADEAYTNMLQAVLFRKN